MYRVLIRPSRAGPRYYKGVLMSLVQPDDGFTQSREMLLLLCSTHQTCVESDE